MFKSNPPSEVLTAETNMDFVLGTLKYGFGLCISYAELTVFRAVCAPGATPEVIQRYLTDGYLQIADDSVLNHV